MRVYSHSFSLTYPWTDVTMAVWLKYPNPFASHVLASDVVERRLTSDGKLLTRRLFLKIGNVPRWGLGILKSSEAYILEDSIVDPVAKTMTTTTRNLSHRSIMSVEEKQTYRPDHINPEHTHVTTEARIVSNFGWGLTGKIEAFGLKKFGDNTNKSRMGLRWVLEKLREKGKDYYSSLNNMRPTNSAA